MCDKVFEFFHELAFFDFEFGKHLFAYRVEIRARFDEFPKTGSGTVENEDLICSQVDDDDFVAEALRDDVGVRPYLISFGGRLRGDRRIRLSRHA